MISDHDDVSVDVICYNTDSAASYEKYDKINIYRIGCLEILPGQFAVPNYVELVLLLRKLKKEHGSYDFVNSHTRFFDNSWWAPLVAKYMSAQSILTDHCASHPVHHNQVIQLLVQKFDSVLASFVPQWYDHVVVVSKVTGQFLKKYGLHNSADVIYAGVNTVFTENHVNDLGKILHLPKDAQVVTFLGRMIPSKNPELLLKAALDIPQTDKKIMFVFAGDGSEYDRLRSQSSENIVFLGKIDKTSAAALLQNTDILVHPSEHHEGLPISLLEAGISGCAVIASNAGATKEVIEDGVTGKIISDTQDLTSTLVELLHDPKEQKRLGKNLKAKVKADFNWQKNSQEYYQLLQNFS